MALYGEGGLHMLYLSYFILPLFLCVSCSNAGLEGNGGVDLSLTLLKSTAELPLVHLVQLSSKVLGTSVNQIPSPELRSTQLVIATEK